MNSPIATGTSRTDNRLAAAIAKVLVNARGLNIRPSCPCSVKTGRKLTVMISSDTKSAGPTSFALSRTTCHRASVLRRLVEKCVRLSPGAGTPAARSRCLCMFSIITMAASIMAPIAMAMPPSDMMSAPTPMRRIARNAIRMPTGSVRMATSAERACHRNTRHTSATMNDSSASFPASVAIARLISSLRSYTGRTTTPRGRPCWTSASFAFTPSIVVSAFWPNRITTMPPTASPRPSSSAMPRRIAGPMETRPSSATRIGVPARDACTTTFSMSLMLLR